MKPYRLYIKTTKKTPLWYSFYSLESVIWFLCDLLNRQNALECILNGTFVQTTFCRKSYEKTYLVMISAPYTEYTIRKITSGSWNKDEITSTIKKVLELYKKEIIDERI